LNHFTVPSTIYVQASFALDWSYCPRPLIQKATHRGRPVFRPERRERRPPVRA